jgi:hypothetical protein
VTGLSGDREYSDLGFDEAFNADQLALGQQPQPQQVAQQQLPQSDDDKKQ